MSEGSREIITLGMSCDKAAYSWCVIDSSRTLPSLIERGNSRVPANVERSHELLWFFREIQNLVNRTHVERAVLKRAETGASARSSSLDHAEMDGVALAALASRDVPVESLKWATLASRFGKRSKADALAIVRAMPISVGVPQSHLDPLVAALSARNP